MTLLKVTGLNVGTTQRRSGDRVTLKLGYGLDHTRPERPRDLNVDGLYHAPRAPGLETRHVDRALPRPGSTLDKATTAADSPTTGHHFDFLRLLHLALRVLRVRPFFFAFVSSSFPAGLLDLKCLYPPLHM